MALRLGIDLDGVLADMQGALIVHGRALFGESVVIRRAPERGAESPARAIETVETAQASCLSLTVSQRKRLWHHVRAIERFWEGLDEIDSGFVTRLAGLAAGRSWEVIFLTKRPETTGSTAQVQSQRWLQARGFPFPSVYIVEGSRGKVAAALELDVVVDDNEENCLDVVTESKAQAIGLFRDVSQPIPAAVRHLGVRVARSAEECLALLCEIETGLKPSSTIERMLKALGLNSSGV